MKISALFWPVQLKGNTIYILDETKLPRRVVYIKVKDYQGACKAIKEMKTRAVGQVLLVMYTFLLELKRNKTDIGEVAEAINSTRPTLSFKMLTDMVLRWQQSRALVARNILGFLEMLKNKRIKQAQETSRIMGNNDVILTHCNVSGLMPLIGEFCRKQNKNIRFYVTETRPYLQGMRLTAWELQNSGFEVTVIADNTVAYIMGQGLVNKVIVGADHLAQNGDIANKIGTYQIALLAKHFRIPFYVLCPPGSSAKTGKDIKIEIRPEKELLEFQGRPIAPKGVRGYYPAFDITPHSLITKHIPLEL